jgi:signal transduction histidine kinase
MTAMDEQRDKRQPSADVLRTAPEQVPRGDGREVAYAMPASEEALRAERKLVRLGLDLHDGPMQDVAEIGMEITLIMKHLAEFRPQHKRLGYVRGQLEDVHARLFALERDLRELAYSTETPAIGIRPFEASVHEQLEEFKRISDLRVEAQLEGDFDGLTPSQRIALIRILEEALANAHKHSGAQSVHVTVTAGSAEISAEIVDDGAGFDVDSTLTRAARRGRLGLVGMAERVRLLGGHFDVESRPGSTRITIRLRRWEEAGLEV